MAEGTYAHACMRAELLGLDRPDEEEFLKHHPQPIENIEAAQFEDVSLQNEELRQVSGGLTELNSILSGTQRKLNRLKGMCGSLTDLLKNKLGGSKDNMSYSTDPSYISVNGAEVGGSVEESKNVSEFSPSNVNASGSELHQQISSQVDKLDMLLDRAENAQYSMQHQNKQMKNFLNK